MSILRQVAILAIFIFLTGCGDGSDSAGSNEVIELKALEGTWKGSISQGKPEKSLSFVLSENQIILIKFDFEFCSKVGTRFAVDLPLNFAAGNTFSVSEQFEDFSFDIRGAFHSDHAASGEFSFENLDCRAGGTWSAEKEGEIEDLQITGPDDNMNALAFSQSPTSLFFRPVDFLVTNTAGDTVFSDLEVAFYVGGHAVFTDLNGNPLAAPFGLKTKTDDRGLARTAVSILVPGCTDTTEVSVTGSVLGTVGSASDVTIFSMTRICGAERR